MLRAEKGLKEFFLNLLILLYFRYEEGKNISENLAQIMNTNSDKLAKLSSLSNEIKNSGTISI